MYSIVGDFPGAETAYRKERFAAAGLPRRRRRRDGPRPSGGGFGRRRPSIRLRPV